MVRGIITNNYTARMVISPSGLCLSIFCVLTHGYQVRVRYFAGTSFVSQTPLTER